MTSLSSYTPHIDSSLGSRSDKQRLPDPTETFTFRGDIIDRYEPKSGQSFDVSSLVTSWYDNIKEFNLSLYDFKQIFTPLLGSIVPMKERITHNISGLTVLDFGDDGEIAKNIQGMSRVAQKPLEDVTEEDRLLYKKCLETICLMVWNSKELQDKKVLIPLRGAGLIADILSVPEENMIFIECKRIPFKDENHVGLGMNLKPRNGKSVEWFFEWYDETLRSLDNKEVVILEVAIASGITTSAFLLELARKKIHPSHIQVVVPVAAQQGVLFSLEMAKTLGMNMSIKAGKLYYRLCNFWTGPEDSILSDSGDFLIGRASDILLNRMLSHSM